MSTSADSVTTAGGDAATAGERWARGAAAGMAAFVAAYVAVVAVIYAFGGQSGSVGEVLRLIGIIFYNAHTVPAVGAGQPLNVLAAAQDPNVPVAVYYAIPILAVGAAGAVLGGRDASDPTEVLSVGAALAVGYALLAVLGALVLSVTLAGGQTVSPDLPKAALFGLAYPVVFGTLGAGAGFAWRNRA
jgi:hypothetical protein